MNVLLWILQIFAALLYGASGVMKVFLFDKISQDVPSFGALPLRDQVIHLHNLHNLRSTGDGILPWTEPPPPPPPCHHPPPPATRRPAPHLAPPRSPAGALCRRAYLD